jgi:hypothetical protein
VYRKPRPFDLVIESLNLGRAGGIRPELRVFNVAAQTPPASKCGSLSDISGPGKLRLVCTENLVCLPYISAQPLRHAKAGELHYWSGGHTRTRRKTACTDANAETERCLNQATDFKIGFFVPGSVLTPMGQVSAPPSMAARSILQNASSCSRVRVVSSASSKAALFHLNMTLSP